MNKFAFSTIGYLVYSLTQIYTFCTYGNELIDEVSTRRCSIFSIRNDNYFTQARTAREGKQDIAQRNENFAPHLENFARKNKKRRPHRPCSTYKKKCSPYRTMALRYGSEFTTAYADDDVAVSPIHPGPPYTHWPFDIRSRYTVYRTYIN